MDSQSKAMPLLDRLAGELLHELTSNEAWVVRSAVKL